MCSRFLIPVTLTVMFACSRQPTESDPVARGKYLVTLAACSDCHTPLKLGANGPEPDMARYLSGHPATPTLPPPPELPEGPWNWTGAATLTAFAGPWGISYAANLTPHESGIKPWTEEQFVAAMRTGEHLGKGRPILPPMPWHYYGQMTDHDLRAVFAYLKSVPPVDNLVPSPAPPKW
jgi:hypothetical protein